jgi:glycosyltransferase involved in cell wall biosynthesis
MDVVFLFMSQSSAQKGSTPDDWEPTEPCAPYYHNDFEHEGYFKLMGDLLTHGVIQKLSIFYESNKGPGLANWVDHPRAHCAVIPEIRFAEKYIQDDTIIFVRGGFKHWHDFLIKYKGRNWLMLYAANTGRQKWHFWDVVLDDITMISRMDEQSRVCLPFIKPIDDAFFTPTVDEAKYDVMLGSSHIHDKKGQWRSVKVLQAYKDKYLKMPTAVLPGAPRRGFRTTAMFDTIASNNELRENIYIPGHVKRQQLKKLYNQSRIALFLGQHGQNDRGPLECLASGTPIILGSPEYHTNWIRKLPSVFPLTDLEHHRSTAAILSFLNGVDKRANKTQTSIGFRELLGYQKSYSWMRELFSFMYAYEPNTKSKRCLTKMFKEMTDEAIGGNL